ncbi:MAG TPA: acyl-CoA dehydrogenase family protein [Armatimonadota bacterium]|nr:acyl-CoA dehydrogenase family protein [Armatimonadota bacterium]
MYSLNDEQTDILKQVEEVASTVIAANAAAVDARSQFPREAIQAFGRAGLLGLNVPRKYGGLGEGPRAACAALDTIAQRCGSTAMVYLMHLAGCAAYQAAPVAAGEVLQQAARGEHLTTLAWSEKGSRSHFWAPVSRAQKRDGQIVLNAEKSFVTSAGEADGYVVSTGSAGSEEPMASTLYLLLKSDPGISVAGAWDSMGMRGNASAPMLFKECVVPAGRELSGEGKGFDAMMAVLPLFSLGCAAVSVGLSEAATGAAVEHIKRSRLQHLGSSLADLPNLRARLAQMRIKTDQARAHLASAIDTVETGSEAAMLMVLEAKAAAAETAIQVSDLGMAACGGAAFSKAMGLERTFRDARAISVMAPTTDVLHDFIGRALCGMPLF